ncbi:MAG TPA: hypothetical protein VFL99_02345 [Segeticoccus sp.]|uniref:hypothetical protein n=1 Tax=Segeticoccus sp. TaxID=2706531 RepID=UPI002D7F7675|nr:hypothetical protein [Segeticoccus sp.]HET8599137.1 hypothetical protein [Segeticoccus sp.]
MADEVLYDDGVVTLDEGGITLRRYYFPLALSKRIRYSDVRGFEQRQMGPLTGKGRVWGSGDLRHWTPLDLKRPQKQVAIILDVGAAVRPTFSPEDPERFVAILQQHVPPVTS